MPTHPNRRREGIRKNLPFPTFSRVRTLGRYFPKNTGDERGAHFAFYDKPVMLLEEEFHDLVFTVCAAALVPHAYSAR